MPNVISVAQKRTVFDLHFAVWHFVRIMVYLEERLKHKKKSKQPSTSKQMQDLYQAWEDVWVDLDAKLLDFGRHDKAQFAWLMMEQEVVISDCNPPIRDLACKLIEGVVAEINQELTKTEDREQTEDLSFERDALTLLCHDFRALK